MDWRDFPLPDGSYSDVRGPCVEWQGNLTKGGYGRVWWRGRHVLAHRMVFALATARDPEGLHVCHKCDNRRCINPAHLFLGTNADNVRDRNNKGRQARLRGEKNGHAKLTLDSVKKIIADPRSGAKIAADYGVSAPTVQAIKGGRIWAHVDRSNVAKNPRGFNGISAHE